MQGIGHRQFNIGNKPLGFIQKIPFKPAKVQFGENTSSEGTPSSSSSNLLPVVNSFETMVGAMENLKEVQNLLSWDLGNHMSSAGAENRVYQLGTIAKALYQLQTGKQVEQLLEVLSQPPVQQQLTPIQKKTFDMVKREVTIAKKIPEDLFGNLIMTKALTHQAWNAAKKANDFKLYAPALETLVQLNRQLAQVVGYEGSPYNVMLGQYEPGMTVAKLDPIFQEVKTGLTPLLCAVNSSKKKNLGVIPRTKFSLKKIWKLGETFLTQIGLKKDTTRLHAGSNAYFLGLGRGDGALALAVNPTDFFSSIASFTHEGGHGLYYQNLDPAFTRTPLQGPASYGIDESQARLMENLVGRSKGFWKHHFPKVKKQFPKLFEGMNLKGFYEAINTVKATLIRGDADELTYNLHILMRYELEKDMFEGKLAVKDLSQAWNQKMKQHLGITPKNDNEGVLQDIHWSYGAFGYFPTYTLGNLYAVQFYEAAKKQVPHLEKSIENGNLTPLTDWLSKNIHQKGKLVSADELVKTVTGEPLNPKYWLDYLWAKLTPVYNLKR
jgi:carboxypeptidase Taq